MARIIGFLGGLVESSRKYAYIVLGEGQMTRAQIVEMASESARRVSANTTGVAPTQEKHAKRFAELKRQKEALEQDLHDYEPFAKRA
jgi:hypothetical protein